MADQDHRGIDKGNPRAPAESLEVKEEHQLEEYSALQFYETVVGYGMGEVGLQGSLNVEKVIVLEITESTEMKQKHDGHYLAVG